MQLGGAAEELTAARGLSLAAEVRVSHCTFRMLPSAVLCPFLSETPGSGRHTSKTKVFHVHELSEGPCEAAVLSVAKMLDLNVERYPTRDAMLTLLRSWLYAADRDTLATRQRTYVDALAIALSALHASPTVVQGIALLRLRATTPVKLHLIRCR